MNAAVLKSMFVSLFIALSFATTSAAATDSIEWSYEPNLASVKMGSSVAVCDVNGDGYEDLFVAAANFTNGQNSEGKIFGFYGSASGLPSSPSWSFEANVGEAMIGDLACGGLVDDDNYEDLIVSGPFFDDGTDAGKVWLFFGSAAGLSGIAWTYDIGSTS
ncbi:MAG: integrin alpha, partial [Deltaproteobacteria bacterium]|nr:integrin alpha [Deltaproteobacteria bacterium]